MSRFEWLVITDNELRAVVHNGDGGHDSFTIIDPRYENPALRDAIDAVEDCVHGVLTQRMRERLSESIAESHEVIKEKVMGFCKMCHAPVSEDDPGIRINGPFLYCRSHA